MDAPLVVPVEGKPFAGELVSIDADGRITFALAPDPAAEAASPRSLRLDELVRWSHPVLPRPQTLVLLDDGSRLVTASDWSGGAAVRLEGDAMVVRPDTCDEAELPRSLVRGLVFAQRSHPQDRQRLEDQVRAAEADHDQVLLANQDRLEGEVTQLSGGSLTLATASGDAKLPLSRVEAVIFGRAVAGGSPQARPQPPGARLIIGLCDGSLLYAMKVQADESQLELQLAGDVKLVGGTRDDIVSLQLLDGKFVYLSDLEPADYRHVPYLEIEWPYRRDRNVLGEPLTVGSQRYLKGLGMHSAARLTYRLDSQYRHFDAAAAVDDSAGGHPQRRVGGSVVFGVYVLKGGQWREAFTSGIVRGGDPPKFVFVDLTGTHAMTLTVDYADRGDELDHADWLDARLVK
jgi:hypothetical protein